MKILSFHILFFIIFIFTISCINHGSNVSQQQVKNSAKYYLTDNQGYPKTNFYSNDKIVFIYTFTNETGKDIGWARAHGGPWVKFLIQRDTLIFIDSYQGLYFIQDAPHRIIKNGETIQEHWELQLSGQLPSGNYTAIACPQILLIGAE